MEKLRIIFTLGGLLLWSMILSGQIPFIQYNSREASFSVPYPPALRQAPSSGNQAEWGIYFWEFGDGHYSFARRPVHRFAREAIYETKVYLTPFYSTDPPLEIHRFLSVGADTMATPHRYDLKGKQVHIETNTGRYLVPGHETQVVVHYQAPAGRPLSGGYLLVFTNNRTESRNLPGGFDPLLWRSERLYYGERHLAPGEMNVAGKVSRSAARIVEQYEKQYRDVRVFEVGPMAAGGDQRLFVTIQADDRLSTAGAGIDQPVSLTAVWIPWEDPFDEKLHTTTHLMRLVPFHNPNHLEVDASEVYYVARRGQVLQYRLNFQQITAASQRDLTVRIPLSPELDPLSVTVFPKKLEPAVSLCGSGDAARDVPCFEQRLSSRSDSLIFTFRNIGRSAASSEELYENHTINGGSITFSVATRRRPEKPTELQAFLDRPGNEVIKTRKVMTRWRQLSLDLGVGQNFGQQAKGFTNAASGFSDRYNFQLNLLETPLDTGWVYGIQMGLSSFSFSRSDLSPVDPGFLLPGGGWWSRSETLAVQYLDLKALAGYQFWRFFRVVGGVGLSLPLKAKLDLEAYAATTADEEPVIYSRSSTSFGLLGDDQPAQVFDQRISADHSIGFAGFLGLEAGLPNDAALGLSREYRHFPRSYHDACAHLWNWNVYVRVKLRSFRPIGFLRSLPR